MSTRRVLACVFLFAAGVLAGLVARQGRPAGSSRREVLAGYAESDVSHPDNFR